MAETPITPHVRVNDSGPERRTFARPVESRAVDDEQRATQLVGYGAVFGEETDIGGWWREVIEPGAFTESIKSADVRCLFNHDPNQLLGRTKNNTLTLAEDVIGLRYESTPPDTVCGRDVLTLVSRGDVNQSSFAFTVKREAWEWPTDSAVLPLRRIKAVELYDVSPVTYPAYPTTTVMARNSALAATEARHQDRESATSEAAANERMRRARLQLAEADAA